MVLAIVCPVFAGWLTLVLVLARRWCLERAARAVKAGNEPADVGYQRFFLGSVQILRFARTGGGLVLLALLMVAQFSSILVVSSGASICILGLSLLTVFILADLVGGVEVDVPALQYLRAFPLTTKDLLRLRAKFLLLSAVPLILLIEAVGGLDLFNRLNLVWGVVLVALVLGVFRLLLGAPLQHWLFQSTPLEHTEWASLAPRIQAWAHLLEVPLPVLYVAQTTPLGTATGWISGFRRPTVFLSDRFLANSDWRQQDALVVSQLLRLRRWAPLPSLAVGSVAAFLWVSAAIASLLAVKVLILLMATIRDGGETFSDLGYLGGLVLLVFFLGNWYVRAFRTSRPRQVLAFDRSIAESTGDPLGLIISFHTLSALSTAPLDRRVPLNTLSLLNVQWAQRPSTPTLEERLLALDQWRQKPGPRVAWADHPVPARIPVVRGTQVLTVPLDQVPSPAPVPTALPSATTTAPSV